MKTVEQSPLELTGASFETTRWTDVAALEDPADSAAALERLVARYWPPVYAHLRAKGCSRAVAAEVTQEFFGDVVLGRELFRAARSSRGSLRSLMLTALRNYRIDRFRRRSGCLGLRPQDVELDQEDSRSYAPSRPGSEGGADPFDVRWAIGILEETLRRCEDHFLTTGRESHWRLFERRIVAPAVRGTHPPPLHSLCGRLGFRSAEVAAAAVQVVKRRALAILRVVVAETVRDDEELEEELKAIREILGG